MRGVSRSSASLGVLEVCCPSFQSPGPLLAIGATGGRGDGMRMSNEGSFLWSAQPTAPPWGRGTGWLAPVHAHSWDTGLTRLVAAQEALFCKQISPFIDPLTELSLLFPDMKCHPPRLGLCSRAPQAGRCFNF